MKKSLMVFVYWLTLFAITLSGADVYSASKYESEPNENKTTATAINFGDKMVGNMWHSLDYDWYSISGVPSGLVSLTAYYEFPSGSTADTDNLYVELRDSSNKVISDFFIDYMDYKTGNPYIKDINIPASGNYYVVVHCPSQAKFKRDRYYISMAKGGGENAKVSILNEEDSVSIIADGESAETLTALVVDEDGNPVVGALVMFYIINNEENELVFSDQDVTNGSTTDPFYIFSGSREISVTYVNGNKRLESDGEKTITIPLPSYFRVQLINVETEEKTILYSATTEGQIQDSIIKNIASDSNYYLDVVENGVWEVKIPRRVESSIEKEEMGSAFTGSDGKAKYTYKSINNIKGEYTVTASFGNSSDSLKVKQIAGTPS
ncbi:MAG: Ig-like domain-containing protein, partial [Desulfamplus sp.]|nr:Ig-like domain-containing protein [Desulfamplus sp.]